MRADTLVLGSGMAGLTIAALLAARGERVVVLEAHDVPGGNAHTFAMGDYNFCAQVHYIFDCGEGEPIDRMLARIGKDVRFFRLDPEGYDHVVIDGDRHRIPNGFIKWRDRLMQRFPDEREGLRKHFALLSAIRDELDRIPDRLTPATVLTAPFQVPHLLRYRNWTLGDHFEQLGLSPRLRAVLAGQCGDYLLPPGQVSLLLHVALISGYHRGAYYPEKHFGHLIDSVVASITERPGCAVLLEHEVAEILLEDGQIAGVRTAAGEVFEADRYISNIDPRQTFELVSGATPSGFQKHLDYNYSCGSFSMYLGIQGLDLRDHGFGSFNIWHYPHDDIDGIYARQVDEHDLSDPWLFLSTPSLHSDAPGLAPPGHQVLEIATSCSYAHFRALHDQSHRAYLKEKTRVRNTILDVLEAQYIPNLRDHLAMRVVGTPTTNERFVWSPLGNAYGAELTPENVTFARVPFTTPYDNLFLVNATAGYPSIGGTVRSALRLYQQLTGEEV